MKNGCPYAVPGAALVGVPTKRGGGGEVGDRSVDRIGFAIYLDLAVFRVLPLRDSGSQVQR